MWYIRRILAKKDLFCSVAFCQVCDTNSHATHVQTVYHRPDAILTKQVFFLKWMLLMYLILFSASVLPTSRTQSERFFDFIGKTAAGALLN